MVTTNTTDSRCAPALEWTVAELAERFGSLPASRIRTDVPPGTATEEDMERVRRDHAVLCELIDGTLVEKAVSDYSSIVGGILLRLVGNFVAERRLGWVHPSDGFVWVGGVQLRAPDVSFTRRNQRPGGKPLRRGYANVAPALAAEVLSPRNTAAEMARKRQEFFASGTELFWIIDPMARTIEVYTQPGESAAILRDGQTLTGEPVLPEFALAVSELFDAADLPDEGSE